MRTLDEIVQEFQLNVDQKVEQRLFEMIGKDGVIKLIEQQDRIKALEAEKQYAINASECNLQEVVKLRARNAALWERMEREIADAQIYGEWTEPEDGHKRTRSEAEARAASRMAEIRKEMEEGK